MNKQNNSFLKRMTKQNVMDLLSGVLKKYDKRVDGKVQTAIDQHTHESFDDLTVGNLKLTETLGMNRAEHSEVGIYSSTLGDNNIASAKSSHAEGTNTIAASESQHVQGRYNIVDENGVFAHIVGNGTVDNLSNAHTLDWEGNATYSGKITVGSGPVDDMDVVNKGYLDTVIENVAFEEATEQDITDILDSLEKRPPARIDSSYTDRDRVD